MASSVIMPLPKFAVTVSVCVCVGDTGLCVSHMFWQFCKLIPIVALQGWEVCDSVCGEEVGVYSWRKPVTAWKNPPPQLIHFHVRCNYTGLHRCVFFKSWICLLSESTKLIFEMLRDVFKKKLYYNILYLRRISGSRVSFFFLLGVE